jgi:hypothetical protein
MDEWRDGSEIEEGCIKGYKRKIDIVKHNG